MRLAVLAATVAFAVAPVATQQPQSTPSAATIAGRVVAADTGEALSYARIVLPATPSRRASTFHADLRGQFALPASARGSRVSVFKSGFARAEVTITTAARLEIRMARGAVISGRAANDFGEPVFGARVTIESADTESVVATGSTDDRGEYRIGGVPSGTYKTAIRWFPSEGKLYFSDRGASSEATAVHVDPGEERAGIDFTIPVDPSLPPIFGGPQPFIRVSPFQRARAAGTAEVRGRIISTDGQAVASAEALLVPDSGIGGLMRTRTNESGEFEFTDVAGGTFQIAASKPGFSMYRAGEAAIGPLALDAAERITVAEGDSRSVDITLVRWGNVSGHVVDEYGEPIQNAGVQLFQTRYERGRRRLVDLSLPVAHTDDRGGYRLYGVPPGQYIVSAAIGDVSTDDLPGYGRAYFPGTTSAGEAQFVSVAAGEDVNGIELALSPLPTARIQGRLLNAKGDPDTSGNLRLLPTPRSISALATPVGARISDGGIFEFPNVPVGQYIIQASRSRSSPSMEGEFGAWPVTVGAADITGLELQTSAGSTIAGHVSFDAYGLGETPSTSRVAVAAVPVDFDLAPQQFARTGVLEDGSFQLRGISGMRRLEPTTVPDGWMVKAVMADGSDITDQPLSFGRANQSLDSVDVVLTDRVTHVAGTVLDERRRPIANAAVIVFSTETDRWYPFSRFMRKTFSGAGGGFSLEGLPPASYYVAAVTRTPPGEDGWQDPAFLESLRPPARIVSLGDGQTVSATPTVR